MSLIKVQTETSQADVIDDDLWHQKSRHSLWYWSFERCELRKRGWAKKRPRLSNRCLRLATTATFWGGDVKERMAIAVVSAKEYFSTYTTDHSYTCTAPAILEIIIL